MWRRWTHKTCHFTGVIVVTTRRWQALALLCPTCMQANASLSEKQTWSHTVEVAMTIKLVWDILPETETKEQSSNHHRHPSNSQDRYQTNFIFGPYILLGDSMLFWFPGISSAGTFYCGLLECVRECGQSVGISSTLEHPPMSCRTSFQAMPFIIWLKNKQF